MSKIEYSNVDCLIVVIMSHGNRDEQGNVQIQARDLKKVELSKYINPLKSIVSLKNKPKLFFVNACRADKEGSYVPVHERDTDDENDENYYGLQKDGNLMCQMKQYHLKHLEIEADFLVSYSTCDRFFSIRSTSKGSWFISSLCEMITKYKDKKDLLGILTRLNRCVADLEGEDVDERIIKMMPICEHQLTKDFYFKRQPIEVFSFFENDCKFD